MEFNNVFESFNDFVNLDPSKPRIISIFGKKGEGKSTWGRALYESWPYDKLAVDVNGDIDPGEDAVVIGPELPDYFPDSEDGSPMNLHYIADPGSDSYFEDLDKAVGLGLYPKDKRVLLWLDEIGEFTSGNKTGPRLRRLLHQSRHYNTSAIMSGPRPKDIDKLVIAQSDIVVVYDLPDPDDQEKIAKVIGYPFQRFSAALEQVRQMGSFYHLVYAASTVTGSRPMLALCNPIDLD